MSATICRTGVYVDAADVTVNGGYGLRYDILRMYSCRDESIPQRMNVYLAYDEERGESDPVYREKTARFCDMLRNFEYKVLERPIKKVKDADTGEYTGKSTIVMDMAVDILTQVDQLDKVILLTSDVSYASVIQTIQNMGCRVELIGFDNVSMALRKEVDYYMSGYLIPGLLPIESAYNWGEVGSRVRGVCYDFAHDDGYGFMRYLNKLNEHIWLTDSRCEKSPYCTVFAHISEFESNFDTSYLPSRDLIFEFDLVENEKGLIANNIELISAP